MMWLLSVTMRCCAASAAACISLNLEYSIEICTCAMLLLLWSASNELWTTASAVAAPSIEPSDTKPRSTLRLAMMLE